MSRSLIRHPTAALLLVSLGCSQQQQTPSESAHRPAPVTAQPPAALRLPMLSPGLHTQTLQRDNAPPVRYTISVPEGFSPEGGVPLILALHYGGKVTPFYGKGLIEALMGPALKELGAVILAPDSLGGEWDTPANEQAVMLLVESVAKSYGVDRKKVVVTGFSMGGKGTWYYAGKYPERFGAALPVAGSPANAAGDWRTPVFAVHGRDDQVLPLEPTRRRIEELKARGIEAELVVLEGVSHYQEDRYVSGLMQAVPWLKGIWK